MQPTTTNAALSLPFQDYRLLIGAILICLIGGVAIVFVGWRALVSDKSARAGGRGYWQIPQTPDTPSETDVGSGTPL